MSEFSNLFTVRETINPVDGYEIRCRACGNVDQITREVVYSMDAEQRYIESHMKRCRTTQSYPYDRGRYASPLSRMDTGQRRRYEALVEMGYLDSVPLPTPVGRSVTVKAKPVTKADAARALAEAEAVCALAFPSNFLEYWGCGKECCRERDEADIQAFVARYEEAECAGTERPKWVPYSQREEAKKTWRARPA